MPRVYKQLLRDEKLWVALIDDKTMTTTTTAADVEALTGRIARYSKALSTELMSAILTATPSSSSAIGTAAVSMASASNSVHLTVAVSGLLLSSSPGGDQAGQLVETLVVRLETMETTDTAAPGGSSSSTSSSSSSSSSRVIEELVTVQKRYIPTAIQITSNAVQCCAVPVRNAH